MFKPGDVVVITEPEDWETGPSFVEEMYAVVHYYTFYDYIPTAPPVHLFNK